MRTPPLDPNDFILTPEQIAEAKKLAALQKKSPPPSKSKSWSRHIQLPISVTEAIARTNCAPAWALAMAIYRGWYEDYKKRNPVLVTSALLAPYGISRQQKLRALKALEATGHYTVDRFTRRNPLVFMKWILPKELKP